MKCALWWAGETALVLLASAVYAVLANPERFSGSVVGGTILAIPGLVFGFVVMKKEWGHHAWS